MNAPALLAPDRTRHDGWLPDRQHDFLAAIADGHTVESAAHAVGLSATAAYSFRRRAPGAPFALGWAAANILARERLAGTLFARAVDGQVETVTRPDGSTYTRHRFDNRLAATMLARLDRYADDPAQGPAVAAARLVAQEFDAFLDVIARDDGPARAGMFLGARAASERDLAPIVALARADRYCRTGAACADEVDISDLDLAARAGWSAGQWQRAEAAGLFVPAPPPEAQGSQLPQLRDPAVDASPPEPAANEPVWWCRHEEHWRTWFPPPKDFDGDEDGTFGDEDYSRTLTIEEVEAFDADFIEQVAQRTVTEGRLRDLYFGFATATPAERAELEAAVAAAAARNRAPEDDQDDEPEEDELEDDPQDDDPQEDEPQDAAPPANPEAACALSATEPPAFPARQGAERMSIFGSIKDAIFGHAKAQSPAAPQAAPAQAPAQAQPPAQAPQAQQPAAQAAPSQPQQPVDVESVLMVFETERGSADLNWRTSIVDLMKLLGLDSSLDHRKQLADELGYAGAKDGSAEMNIWLHKAVMRELEKSGGTVPASLKD